MGIRLWITSLHPRQPITSFLLVWFHSLTVKQYPFKILSMSSNLIGAISLGYVLVQVNQSPSYGRKKGIIFFINSKWIIKKSIDFFKFHFLLIFLTYVVLCDNIDVWKKHLHPSSTQLSVK